MFDRRDFVRAAAAGLASGSLLSAAEPKERDLDALRAVFRWISGGLTFVPDGKVRVGDYVIFADARSGWMASPIDLFVGELPPAGRGEDVVLYPLGRDSDLEGALHTIRAHAAELSAVFARGGDRLELVR